MIKTEYQYKVGNRVFDSILTASQFACDKSEFLTSFKSLERSTVHLQNMNQFGHGEVQWNKKVTLAQLKRYMTKHGFEYITILGQKITSEQFKTLIKDYQ